MDRTNREEVTDDQYHVIRIVGSMGLLLVAPGLSRPLIPLEVENALTIPADAGEIDKVHVRRLHGVLVAAVLWGFAFWALSAAFLVGMLIVGGDTPTSILRGLIDVAPTALSIGGICGAAFAVILSIMGRKQRLTGLSKQDVGRWGFAAGLCTALVLLLWDGSQPLLAWDHAAFALSLGVTSSFLATATFRMARARDQLA
jgi:hypothetical protein